MEKMIIDFISTIGIPAGIAVFVLVRLENTLSCVQRSMDRNTRVLAVLLKSLSCSGLDDELEDLIMDDENCTTNKKAVK